MNNICRQLSEIKEVKAVVMTISYRLKDTSYISLKKLTDAVLDLIKQAQERTTRFELLRLKRHLK
jgi:hypothetical protein